MQPETLNALVNILTAIFTFVGGGFAAYLAFRSKWKESGDTLEIARVNNADDMLTAVGSLQAQLAQAAENMVAPLNRQIEEQTKQLKQQAAELSELRIHHKKKVQEQEQLEKRVRVLEIENAELRGELAKEVEAEKRLRARLGKIRQQIDTGELSSGVHKLPPRSGDEIGD